MSISLFSVIFGASLGGFCTLSLAMDRHYEDLYGRGKEPGVKRRWLQLTGSALLFIALAASLHLGGSTVGWVLWLGALTTAALVMVVVLSYAPRRAHWAGWLALGIGLLGLALFIVGQMAVTL